MLEAPYLDEASWNFLHLIRHAAGKRHTPQRSWREQRQFQGQGKTRAGAAACREQQKDQEPRSRSLRLRCGNDRCCHDGKFLGSRQRASSPLPRFIRTCATLAHEGSDPCSNFLECRIFLRRRRQKKTRSFSTGFWTMARHSPSSCGQCTDGLGSRTTGRGA
jgi:hypothetical protein